MDRRLSVVRFGFFIVPLWRQGVRSHLQLVIHQLRRGFSLLSSARECGSCSFTTWDFELGNFWLLLKWLSARPSPSGFKRLIDSCLRHCVIVLYCYCLSCILGIKWWLFVPSAFRAFVCFIAIKLVYRRCRVKDPREVRFYRVLLNIILYPRLLHFFGNRILFEYRKKP